MAANKIKGLTVEIGGDTTKLGKALEDVNKKSRDLSSELGDINKLLKLDPSNTDLLAQKQKVLAEAVSNTGKKLDTLKEAEKQVQQQFERGEVSEDQVRALQREIIEAEKKMGSYKNAVKETADALDNLGKKSKEALEKTAEANNKMAGGLAKGLGGAAAAATAAVTALVGTAEATREYRTEMGKLDTAFTQNGHSSEAAQNTYKSLQSVLGETDQAVEAANHLAKLTDNEEDLAKWSGDILPGVFATFGASLPIEGLTEAANETAKTGALTGSLADALNWAGVSEDDFQTKLDKCNTERERQALITETLTGLYGDASAAYKETNQDIIAANEANEKWAAGMAEIGAYMDPVITEVKSLGADLLSMVVPAIETILNNLPAIGVAVGGVTAAIIAFKVAALAATAASKGMTLAQYAMTAAQTALNVVLNANPIGLVILAITALVAAFMVLWKNCEGFRNFWIKLWDNIKKYAKIALDGIVGFFKKLPDHLKALPSKMLTIGKDLVKGLWNGIKDMTSWVKDKISGFSKTVLDGIKGFFGIKSPSRVMRDQVGKMLAVGLAEGITANAQLPVDAMEKMANDVVGVADNIMGSLSLFDPAGVLTDPTSIDGADLVDNLATQVTALQTYSDEMEKLRAKIGGTDLFAALQEMGVKSLNEVQAINRMNDAQVLRYAEMYDQKQGLAAKLAYSQAGGATIEKYLGEANASSINGLALERSVSGAGSYGTATSAAGDVSAMLKKLDGIYERLGRLKMVTDRDALVGEIIDIIDSKLAGRQALVGRGVC